ncbi:hypothetical protein ACFPM1_07095 [Halorubrum rubrum]|uniref:Uncharacterized protein n=1 Tax=Halorubrum rubrum TaxID=1126240 RepID=A0ABD5R139_9EURY|nr:hypothetical protein [Halorubrum rubrum]
MFDSSFELIQATILISGADLSTAVVASIVGAVVAGIISAVINGMSLLAQYQINEKNQKNIVKRRWKRETIKTLRELERVVLNFDPSDSPENDIEIIDNLVSEIEDQKGVIPDKFDNIESDLTEITLANERRGSDDYYDSMFEYRSELLQKVQDTLDNFNH